MKDEVDRLGGHALSGAIAREVFGETPPVSAQYVGGGRYYVDTDYSCTPWREEYWPTPYANDIDAAIRVIEKMRDTRPEADEPEAWTIRDCGNEGWRVEIEWLHHDGAIPVCHAVAKSLPLAICRCALRRSRIRARAAAF
jgi:hypothetical protein